MRMVSGLSSPELQMQLSHTRRQVSGRSAFALSRVALKTLCVFICFSTPSFSRECWLMHFAQAPCTPISPPTRHSEQRLAPSFQRSYMASCTRHPPLTWRPPEASNLTKSTPFSVHPTHDLSIQGYITSRLLTCTPYSPRDTTHQFPPLPRIQPSWSTERASFTFRLTFTPLPVLMRGDRASIALEEPCMYVDDAAVDDLTQNQN